MSAAVRRRPECTSQTSTAAPSEYAIWVAIWPTHPWPTTSTFSPARTSMLRHTWTATPAIPSSAAWLLSIESGSRTRSSSCGTTTYSRWFDTSQAPLNRTSPTSSPVTSGPTSVTSPTFWYPSGAGSPASGVE